MIYLDNAATTRPYPQLKKTIDSVLENDWYNPSSLYDPSVKTARKIKEARQTIADLIGFKPSEIIFTSGSTEGNNMVLSYSQGWRKIITTKIEHKSVSAPVTKRENIDYTSVAYVSVDKQGRIDLKDLEGELLSDYSFEDRSKVLVSIIAVNNEIGTIQDIKKIAMLCDQYGAILHLDCTQAMGKIDLDYGVADIITASAHKFHGLKGVGFVASRIKLNPFLLGGHQENDMRAGTENALGIITMAGALKMSYERMDINFDLIDQYKHELKSELAKIDDVRFNDDPDNPYILSVSFKDVNAESLLYLLSLKHIYVSSGSACNSKEQKVSPILMAIDVPPEYIYGTIRLSFSDENCVDEIPVIVNTIKDCVASIRHSRGVKDIG